LKEKLEFKVDDLTYIVEFNGHEFFLYVDGSKSRTKIHETPDPKDPFYGYDRHEGENTRVVLMSNLVKTKNPMAIFRNVLKFVDQMIGKHKPYRFSFGANEKKKRALYRRVAEKLVRKHPYYLDANKGSFVFYRLVDCSEDAHLHHMHS